MSQRAIPLARTGVLLPFVRFLDDIGAPVEPLMENARLSPQLLGWPEAVFPLHQGLEFIEAAANSQGVENLGLIVGQRTRIADLRDLEQLLSPSMTLRAALVLLVRTISLYNSGEVLALCCRSDQAILSHDFRFREAAGRRHGDVFTLMVIIDVIRLAAGPGWRPEAVSLCTSEASRKNLYEDALQTAVVFGPNRWAIFFDRQLLDEPLRYFRSLRRAAANHPREQLRRAAPADDFAGSLRQVILSLLPQGNPHIGIVARVANLSTRTLQRRLAQANISHSRLLGEARLQMALRLLRQPEIKITEVAFELGYSDASNFTRAFRRWTGSSPQATRRTLTGRAPQPARQEG